MILLVTVTHPGSCTVSHCHPEYADVSWTTSDKQSIRESLGKGLLEIVNMENMADEGLNLTNMDEARVLANAQSVHTLAITLNTLDAEPPKCLITASSSMQGSHVIAFVMHLCYTPPTIPNLTFEQRCKCMPMAR